MSLAVVISRAAIGLESPEVKVEVHLSGGLPAFIIVGLPETAVKESRERVRAALLNNNFEFPARRITINLAPADLPKEGGRFDLPIAIGLLAASEQIPDTSLNQYEFAGELALNGDLRPIKGALPLALAARESGKGIVVPLANAEEAALASGVEVFAAEQLLQITAHLNGQSQIVPYSSNREIAQRPAEYPDMSEVRGQHQAKRALEIAAAGGHSLLMVGPPGSGKTMLACRLPGIAPSMSEEEAIESAAVQSVSGIGFSIDKWRQRPFRAPHHTASGVALVGGGSQPRPGEISLAHHGVLFLDELLEYDRRVLEVLREPLESGRIIISRAARQAEFPARFQFIAAMNPCPCGYLGHSNGKCHCSGEQISRYRHRLSGPLLDRIDLIIDVATLPHQELLQPVEGEESSATIRSRVEAARRRQMARGATVNSRLVIREMEKFCPLDSKTNGLLGAAMEKLSLSARACHRIIRVARTIADLAGVEEITTEHLAEAINYRRWAPRESR